MFDPKKTLGENRVRTSFNPSDSDIVSQIKQKGAELINLINSLPVQEGPEAGELHRLKSIAMTEQETATEKAVKAATFYF